MFRGPNITLAEGFVQSLPEVETRGVPHDGTGFKSLYEGIVQELHGRTCIVYPDAIPDVLGNALAAAKNGLSRIFKDANVPAPKRKRGLDSYRFAVNAQGNVVCETMPDREFAFELDSKGRLIRIAKAGDGIPQWVVERFSPEAGK
jgi:hypothetical protein